MGYILSGVFTGVGVASSVGAVVYGAPFETLIGCALWVVAGAIVFPQRYPDYTGSKR